VVEPKLAFSASFTPTNAAPTDVVTVTVDMKNPKVTNGATAYETTVTYTLPAGQMTAQPKTYNPGTCPAGIATLSGTSVTIEYDSIPMATDCQFSFQVAMDVSATPAKLDTAVSLATWTSQPGTTTVPLSTWAADSTRRTGNATDPGGAVNDYRQTGFDAAVQVPASYFNGGIGASGGGCSATGGSDLAWVGLLLGLLALARRRMPAKDRA